MMWPLQEMMKGRWWTFQWMEICAKTDSATDKALLHLCQAKKMRWKLAHIIILQLSSQREDARVE